MKVIVGKSFAIPDDIQESLISLEKDRNNAFNSAKEFMDQKNKIEDYMKEIIKENLEIVNDHDFKIDMSEMKVTIIEKNNVDK